MIVLKDKLKRHKVMTQEEKELLLKDLCSRLPHDVIVEYGVKHEGRDLGEKKGKLTGRMLDSYFYNITVGLSQVYSIKPYIRPMSSMTEEERKDLLITLLGKNDIKYFKVLQDGSIDNNNATHQDLSNFNIHWINFDGVNASTYIDWLNKNKFDYRGLIPKGLALEVTNENNPYKET